MAMILALVIAGGLLVGSLYYSQSPENQLQNTDIPDLESRELESGMQGSQKQEAQVPETDLQGLPTGESQVSETDVQEIQAQVSAEQPLQAQSDYASHIFDDTYVHEIDIQLPKVNWDYMLLHAEEEQYVLCDVVIDGEKIKDVAIRPKGNSSLKAIKTQGSDHFSFKIEFDHYKKHKSYYGLDKLALNNLGQDVSCMKDYFTYHMMNEVGIAAPLSSYAHLKLNGEDFGLYLAVEAIEDAFAARNYGTSAADIGNLYKPEPFSIENVTPTAFMNTKEAPLQTDYSQCGPGDRAELIGDFLRAPFEGAFGTNMEVAALNYVGDDLERYQVIFDSAVFDINKEDKRELIQALKVLNTEGQSLDAVDVEDVLKFLVVHNFVNNYDSFSSIFVHNYYLREKDGRLSFIPWDYNLSLGIYTFKSMTRSYLGKDSPYLVTPMVGQAMDDDTSMVNFPIDTPTFSVSLEERPLLKAVLTDDQCLKQYHQDYQDFLNAYFASGKFEQMYRQVLENISSYVEAGQTFYDYESFLTASDILHQYFLLREESIRRQLDGRLPATKEGQSQDYANLVDASFLNLGDTAVFDSLIFGISSDNVTEILDAIAGDYPHTAEGLGQSVTAAMEDTSKIGPIIARVLTSSSLIKSGIANAVKAPTMLILSIIVLLVARKRAKKYSRRRLFGTNLRNAVRINSENNRR